MRQLFIITTAILAIASCTNYHYDDALQKKIEDEGRNKTETWFKNNKPEADSVSVETVYRSAWGFITNIVQGTYMIDTLEYEYMFNYETSTCYTDEHIEELKDSVKAKLQTMNVSNSIITNYYYEDSIKGQTISNKTDFPYSHYYKEIEREDITEHITMLPWNVTQEDIIRITEQELKKFK